MTDPEIAALGRRQALTAIVPVPPAQVAGLEAKLLLRRNQWALGLRACASLHFAKLALIPPAKPGQDAGLWVETTFDGALGDHLGELWDHSGAAYADVLQSCAGGERLDRQGFHALLDRHALRARAACSAHDGLSRAVIDNDARLDRLAQGFLDHEQRERRYRVGSSLELVQRLREQLAAPGAPWVGSLAPAPDRSAAQRGVARRLELALARFGFARGPRTVPFEAKERRPAETGVQSSSLVLVPAAGGRFRRWALFALLAELGERGAADLETEPHELARLHAGRWVVLGDGRLLVSLIHDGTSQAFRAALPESSFGALALPAEAVELYPQIWYSAYPELSVGDVLRNHRIRELLARPLDRQAAHALCTMF